MNSTKSRRLEKGQAGLEFVIIMPVLLGALFLVTVVGNQLYQKLSSQAFVYSHCMWGIDDWGVAGGDTAFDASVDITKNTWSTEGVWQDFPIFPKKRVDLGEMAFFVKKKCTASVTHDEWNKVGFGHIFSYNPDVLVESSLTVIRPNYANETSNYPNFRPLKLWGDQ